MAFDPRLPLEDSEIESQVLRNQFNGLRDALGALEDQVSTCAQIPGGVAPLSLPISNPPTQGQVTALRDKINELLAALQG